MPEVFSAGVSRQQVQDALAVYAAFSATARLADASASSCSALSVRGRSQVPAHAGLPIALQLPANTIGELIFGDGVSRKGSAMLAESQTITGEAEAAPMEIARDAWRATQQLKQLLGGMEPGLASQA